MDKLDEVLSACRAWVKEVGSSRPMVGDGFEWGEADDELYRAIKEFLRDDELESDESPSVPRQEDRIVVGPAGVNQVQISGGRVFSYQTITEADFRGGEDQRPEEAQAAPSPGPFWFINPGQQR